MKKIIAFFYCLALCGSTHLLAQKWIDTTYQISIDRNNVYGLVDDFAGQTQTLQIDICYPINDNPPECGRPLILIIHGGAWMTGSKDDGEVQRLMKDFAKRGFVAAAMNYRLGVFHPKTYRNCNINNLGVDWNCVNVQDTAEWYRAYYRAVQDGKGALRYMVDRWELFNINVNNSFVCGFSAGGYTAAGVAFLDHASEWLSMSDSISDAERPASGYDASCINKYNWGTSTSSMDLKRASLGNYEGTLHYPPRIDFKIKGLGNFYGGMFYNLLDSTDKDYPLPAIYGFHQPNDLIVPYKGARRVFDGLSSCAYSACGRGIINRPLSYSSSSINQWSLSLKNQGKPYPRMVFDSTKNNTDCLGQIANPSLGGHQLDNYWLRTNNMASLFASVIDT